MSQFTFNRTAPIEELIVTAEVHGKVDLTYSFSPPIPAGTRIVLRAESSDGSPVGFYLLDWKECPLGGQKENKQCQTKRKGQ